MIGLLSTKCLTLESSIDTHEVNTSSEWPGNEVGVLSLINLTALVVVAISVASRSLSGVKRRIEWWAEHIF